MEMATPILRLPGEFGFKYPTLEVAHRLLCGTEYASRHRADEDMQATLRVWRAIKQKRQAI